MRSERRRAREAAMRALYQMDMSGCSPEWAVAFAVNDSADLDLPERARSYAVELVMGAVERIREIDEIMTDENFVRIVMKTGRIIRLPTRLLEFEEKQAVRKFLKETTGF